MSTCRLIASSCVVWSAAAVVGAEARTDANGRIVALEIEGEPIDIRTNLRVPLAGWRSLPSLDHATGVKRSEVGGRRTWRGRIEMGKGAWYRYEQTISPGDGALRLSYRVTADADVKTEGVFFWLDLPVRVFGGGSCELSRGQAVIERATMPEEPARPRHFARADADGITITAGRGTPRLRLELDKVCHVTVQDNREWNTPTYSAFVRFPESPLARGQSAALDVVLRLSGRADHSPATLTLDARAKRYRLDGFGGNYCFGIESPVTRYTLDNLRVAWARTEMTLPEWEPRNDNDSPTRTDWGFLEGRDRPGTNLRREFLLAQDIQRRGIPYSITIWHLPEWLYEKPRTDGKRPNRRRIHPGKWDELLECVGTYLVHARKQYGVEPDLFSFNEANIGVRVLLTPEEHRTAIKRIGAHLEGLGLKTRMLLADATGPRGTHTYAGPAAGDPEAMRYVGAVGFHSWGGATPEQYGAWGDLADRLELPLLVTELGVDAGAWRGRRYRSFHYGLSEVRMYQELLLHARPRGTMQWEFTSDYGMVDTERDDAGDEKLVPHVRFWFVKHFCDLTPPNGAALSTRSGHAAVLFTAFEGRAGQKTVYTLHIANMAASRPVTIRGIPAGIKELRAVRTGRGEAFKELGPVAVHGGVVKTALAPQSLLTLTTMP